MSRIISGEPLPTPPRALDPEVDAYNRKIIDYLRRLSAKLQALLNGAGSAVECYSAWFDASQTVAAAYATITWNKDLHVDGPYSHSMTVDPGKITVVLDGLYLVCCDLQVDAAVQGAIKLTNTNTGAVSYVKFGYSNSGAETLSMAIPLPLIAGITIEVQLQDSLGTTTVNTLGSRITILRLSPLSTGGSTGGGSGWTTGWQLVEM